MLPENNPLEAEPNNQGEQQQGNSVEGGESSRNNVNNMQERQNNSDNIGEENQSGQDEPDKSAPNKKMGVIVTSLFTAGILLATAFKEYER